MQELNAIHNGVTRALVLGASGALLAACGGSSGSGSSPSVTPYSTAHLSTINADQVDETGADATVVVVDGGLRVSHDEFEHFHDGQLHEASASMLEGHDDLGEDSGNSDVAHGTAVSSLAVGGNLGVAPDATLLAYQVDPGGSHFEEAVTDAAGALSQSDRPVLNLSAGFISDPRHKTSIEYALDDFRSEAGGLVVLIAGNTDGDNPYGVAGHYADDADGDVIIAGSLNWSGDDITSNTRRAGDSSDYFLLAPAQSVQVAGDDADDDYAIKNGTSLAAPLISGAAALVWSAHPDADLGGADVAQILLDTASTDMLDDYDPEVHGRGVLDVAEALSPQGEPTVALASVDDEDSATLHGTGITTGPAFGDALTASSAFASVVAFDRYGRDFSFDLSGTITRPTDSSIDRAMARSHALRETRQKQMERFGYVAHYANGSLEALDSSVRLGAGTEAGFVARSTMAAMPQDAPVDLVGGHALLSSYSADPFLHEWDAAQGGYLTHSAGRFGLSVQHMVSGSHAATPDAHRQAEGVRAAARTVARARFEPVADLSLGVSAGMAQDDERLFGTHGSGALALNAPSTTQTLGIDVAYAATDRVGVFAQYEQGYTNDMEFENRLVSAIRGLRTSSASAGFVAQVGDGARFGGVATQPLRVESGRADLTIPTGRTPEGDVLLDHTSADLTPSGRQRDFELFLDLEGDVAANRSTRFNVVYSREPGHVASESSDYGAMLTHYRRF